jgi:hypothetical protein
MQCLGDGLCRTSKDEVLGLGADANTHCAAEDFHYTTQWCSLRGVYEEQRPACAPRSDVPACNSHGTCVSSTHAQTGIVLSYRTPTMAVYGGACLVLLTEEGHVLQVPWPSQPGASCGDAEGARVAGQFTGDMDDTFTQLLKVGQDAIAVTAAGEVWTIFTAFASVDMVPFRWELDYAALAAANERFVALSGSGVYPLAIFGHTVYAILSDGSGTTSAIATIPAHLDPLPHVIGSMNYMAVATQSGDWWYFYSHGAPWTSAFCCDFHPSNRNLLPVNSIGPGIRVLALSFHQHTPYALTTGGIVRKWAQADLQWGQLAFGSTTYATALGTDFARIGWASTPDAAPSVFIPNVPTLVVPLETPVIEISDDGGNSAGAMRTDGVVVLWGTPATATPYEFDVAASTSLKPMGAQPMARRFFTIVSGVAEDTTEHASQLLGSMLVVANPDESLLVGQACACDTGWAGAFCTTQTACLDGAATGAACTSGLTPGPRINPTLDLVLQPANADPAASSLPETQGAGAGAGAGAAGHVRLVGTPPSLQARTESTRVHVLRQREVDLDTASVFLRVSGATDVEARRYTPARAEYLCYRAHRAGRVMAAADVGTMRPMDLQAVVRELDAPSSGPVPTDGMFWVRKDAPGGGWAYAAVDKTLTEVRAYMDEEPTVVANLVCAYDHDVPLGVAPTLDAYYRCKLPQWFCELWATASSLQYCGWMGVA